MIRVFVVDDEAPARDELKYLLEQMPDVSVVGMARNGREALELIPLAKPQVVFLDIQMPDLSGLAVARELLALMDEGDFPLLVFATAFDRHALEAFEVHALDYILKPFSAERLKNAMDHLRRTLAGRSPAQGPEAEKLDRILSLLEKPPRPKLAVEENERIILLNVDEIVYAWVEDRHVFVKTKDASYQTGYSLSELEERLGLLQTHKSYVVNRDQVREVIPWFNGTYNLVMADREKSQVPVSRTYVKSVRQALRL
ncbi:Two component system, signal transduction response regulator [Acididesulfobacillus acetoxydans]|uniref:Stage 0 sporulation protein A homolog n=1 Tax=Acididesulfobacillus acetoxydans TaxID=1561005 RepID=A0A8S0VX02_9FIRM|nr:LytTR family transcriptional regulator DNA-binding domain-containing protein [Acididesulfobacillus acetoxydans]CAA7601423.1 Two component system, signal transduction response regulator [Acididesulfobacillus acetoxydans]CEJ08854.1 Sensory transduction protein LytT [Acididesulfobacillus acetoxydans]